MSYGTAKWAAGFSAVWLAMSIVGTSWHDVLTGVFAGGVVMCCLEAIKAIQS